MQNSENAPRGWWLLGIAGFGVSPGVATLTAVALTIVAFGPVAGFALMAGTVGEGVDVPLFSDIATLVRLLLVLPLLVTAAPHLDNLVQDALRHMGVSGLVSTDRIEAYRSRVHRMGRLRDSKLVTIVCLAVGIIPAVLNPLMPGPLAPLSNWAALGDQHHSPAGMWHNWVSIPILRYVLLLWMWRLLLWVVFLWRLPSLQLDLRPAHPDCSAGLGFLGFVQQRLSIVIAAAGMMLAGTAANHILYLGKTFEDLRYLLLGFVVLYPLLLVLPLFRIVPMLLMEKRRGVLLYGSLAYAMAKEFDTIWLSPHTQAKRTDLLESPHPSALADFGAVHANVQNLKWLPLTKGNLLWMIAAAIAPLTLLVFTVVPFEYLVRAVLLEMPPVDLLLKSP